MRAAQAARAWGQYHQARQRNQGTVWDHGERRNQSPEVLSWGNRVAFTVGICFVDGHREMRLETSFQSECVVF